MTTRRMLQRRPGGKHRPSTITPYVSIFGIPEGEFFVFGGRRGRARKLTMEMIYRALDPRGELKKEPHHA